MSYSLLKLVTASGATATAGAGIAASTLVFSEPKETTTYSTTSSHIEDEEILPQLEESLEHIEEEEASPVIMEPVKVPETPKCSIYEVKEPTRIDSTTRVIKEILKKIEQSKEEFLSQGAKSPTFKKEIEEACPSHLGTSKNVYVWQDSKGWQYSSGLQQDWLKDSSVKKPNGLGVASEK